MNDYSERYDINRIPLPDVESKKNAKALEELTVKITLQPDDLKKLGFTETPSYDKAYNALVEAINVMGGSRIDDRIITHKVDGYGTFEILKSVEYDYSGVDIEFIPEHPEKNACTNPRVIMEIPFANYREGESPKMRTLIWADKTQEDYTDSVEFDYDLQPIQVQEHEER